jgi:hypothetical protein
VAAFVDGIVSELPEDTIELARFLIGKVLVRGHRGNRTGGGSSN